MSLDSPIRFDGPVECRIDRDEPLGLALTGRRGTEVWHVTFVGTPPADFPPRLDAVVIEPAGADEYRVVSGGGERMVRAQRVFVHRDVRHVFCAAVPARPPPLPKRLLWRAVLAFAGSPLGRWVLGNARDGTD